MIQREAANKLISILEVWGWEGKQIEQRRSFYLGGFYECDDFYRELIRVHR